MFLRGFNTPQKKQFTRNILTAILIFFKRKAIFTQKTITVFPPMYFFTSSLEMAYLVFSFEFIQTYHLIVCVLYDKSDLVLLVKPMASCQKIQIR